MPGRHSCFFGRSSGCAGTHSYSHENGDTAGQRLSAADGLALFNSPHVMDIGALAQWSARAKHGRRVYYVVNGHINYSNFCTLSCAFCSFYRRKGRDRRAGGYEMLLEEVLHHGDEIALPAARRRSTSSGVCIRIFRSATLHGHVAGHQEKAPARRPQMSSRRLRSTTSARSPDCPPKETYR